MGRARAKRQPAKSPGGRPRSRELCAEGIAIEAAAVERGMSRQMVADAVGINYVSLLRILVGDGQPTMETAKKIARAVGREVGDIWK
jgi:DNA-binding XRE family transcriptional regulator